MSANMEHLRTELLADVAAHASSVLQDHGVVPEVADQAGAAIADHLADHWGGQVLTIPKDYAFRLAQRDLRVLTAYNAGDNIMVLSRRYHMTQRGIRKLLARSQLRQRDDFQGKLFG